MPKASAAAAAAGPIIWPCREAAPGRGIRHCIKVAYANSLCGCGSTRPHSLALQGSHLRRWHGSMLLFGRCLIRRSILCAGSQPSRWCFKAAAHGWQRPPCSQAMELRSLPLRDVRSRQRVISGHHSSHQSRSHMGCWPWGKGTCDRQRSEESKLANADTCQQCTLAQQRRTLDTKSCANVSQWRIRCGCVMIWFEIAWRGLSLQQQGHARTRAFSWRPCAFGSPSMWAASPMASIDTLLGRMPGSVPFRRGSIACIHSTTSSM